MKNLSTVLLVIVTMVNIVVAYYVINLPVTTIQNIKTYSDATQQNTEPKVKSIDAEPIGITI